jgi:hypothetical protein
MSVDYFIFVQESCLPTIVEWQRALDDAETGIVLDDVGDLRSHTGYLPARYHGDRSGFEFFFGTAKDVFGSEPQEVGSRSHAIDFVTHSDMQELMCGMIAGAVLAKVADGLVFDEDSGTFVDGDKALQTAKKAEASSL